MSQLRPPVSVGLSLGRSETEHKARKRETGGRKLCGSFPFTSTRRFAAQQVGSCAPVLRAWGPEIVVEVVAGKFMSAFVRAVES